MKEHLSLRLVEIDCDGVAGGLADQLVVHLGESHQVGVTPTEFPDLRIPKTRSLLHQFLGPVVELCRDQQPGGMHTFIVFGGAVVHKICQNCTYLSHQG